MALLSQEKKTPCSSSSIRKSIFALSLLALVIFFLSGCYDGPPRHHGDRDHYRDSDADLQAAALLLSREPGNSSAIVILKRGRSRSARHLHPLLRNRDVRVRLAAIRILATYPGEDSFDHFYFCLSDSSVDVVYYSNVGLQNLLHVKKDLIMHRDGRPDREAQRRFWHGRNPKHPDNPRMHKTPHPRTPPPTAKNKHPEKTPARRIHQPEHSKDPRHNGDRPGKEGPNRKDKREKQPNKDNRKDKDKGQPKKADSPSPSPGKKR